MAQDPASVYAAEKARHAAALQLLQQKHNRLGWLRLLTLAGTAIGAYQLFMAAGAWAWVVVLGGIALFLWVVSVDANNNRKLNFVKQLLHINEEELRILAGQFNHRSTGSQFAPQVHDYAADLDLFGAYSLYQYINRCSSEQANALLANNLLEPLPVDEILLRQQAVEEWAPQLQWRQELQAIAALSPITTNTQLRLERWLAQKDESFTHPAWKWVVPVYTLFACGIAAAAIFDLIPGALFSAMLFLFIITSFALGKKATATSMQLSGVVAEMESLAGILQCLEKPTFKSSLLQQLQESITNANSTASKEIHGLKSILNRFDLRLNVFLFIFLNAFLLWDVRQMMALHRWRMGNKNAVSNWFWAITQAEVLNSLAVLRFNKPTWVQPQFTTPYFYFEATGVGHPLLPEDQRITSDFELKGTGKIALITGSNMAGKSTFLRSLGVAVVLAQMGAVVCARSLLLSPVQLLSSMRIADNLAENTSTFYAELKKLKVIIEAVREKRPVLVLLDEILRGTNSLDRHTGSKALIQQLIREESVAVLATHDVELAALEQQYPRSIENYHFDVQVAGEELYFDYKLKTGICSNLNASVLMRKIGIELDDETPRA
ncbi:MutS-related protein [Pseudocnuella soli]|uniref:MutS-related protein n=1 Tax=Pseudocnuella soli TaxID=2502779 RepID=UPI00104FC189|nr:hypothetical protein [Pseudocnuella soli]